MQPASVLPGYGFFERRKEIFIMAGEKLLQKKRQEFIQQHREEVQQSEDYFFHYADMNQFLEQEA